MNNLRRLAAGFVCLLMWAGAVDGAWAENEAPLDRSELAPLESTRIPAPAPPPESERRRLARGQFAVGVESTYLRQFETRIGPAGRFAADRLLTRVSVRYGITDKFPLGLSFGYRLDAYDFSGDGDSEFPLRPWSTVHSPRVTLPVFLPLSKRWLVVGGLTVRSTVEEGAPLEDGVTGGGFFGAGYKVNDRLTIGPGFGLLTQLEDSLSFFPVVLVEWKIRPNLKLGTGRGVGSTQGPGVFLEWKKSSRWSFSAGGRYERLRFRLDDRGVAPRGIGEEASFAFVGFARFKASSKLQLTASLGANFAGTLRLEDRQGRRLFSDSYDSALLAGIGLSLDL